MVNAVGTPPRHPESGIYLFRKRVPARLKASVGKSEIKFSLKTRDPILARIRNLEEMARLEREWAGIDAPIIDGRQAPLAPIDCKSVVGAVIQATNRADPPVAVAAPAKATLPLRSVFGAYAREAVHAPSTV